MTDKTFTITITDNETGEKLVNETAVKNYVFNAEQKEGHHGEMYTACSIGGVTYSKITRLCVGLCAEVNRAFNERLQPILERETKEAAK
jgi:protein-arginine kinase activator protein McsA